MTKFFKYYSVSLIDFFIKELSTVVIIRWALYPLILWFHEIVPLCPVGVLHFVISDFIGISFVIGDQLVQICQHADKNATFFPLFCEIF